MGLYDRDYVRTEPTGNWFADRPAVVQIILINAAIFLADILLFDRSLSDWLGLEQTVYLQPWRLYELITYGFLHDTATFGHILFNMYALWLFGSSVEPRIGRQEFWRLYMVALVVAGLAWLALRGLLYPEGNALLVGASGAVTCVMMLYVLFFPTRTLLLFFVLPVPAWALGVLYLLVDMVGFSRSIQGVGPPVAYEAHLAGALLGFLYVRYGWNFGRWVPNVSGWKRKMFGPRLRVHQEPSGGQEEEVELGLNERVDRILEKISRHGPDSLTAQERRILEDASRRYQRRRQ